MVSVAAFTGGKSVPSARFRVGQHIECLKKYDISIKEFPAWPPRNGTELTKSLRNHALLYKALIKAESVIMAGLRVSQVLSIKNDFDAVWVSKSILPGKVGLEESINKPLFLDIDDAIWLHSPNIFRAAKRSACIFAGNSFIADRFAEYCQKVAVIPTAIDTGRFYPDINKRVGNKFIVVWTGSGDNLRFLYKIEAEIATFLLKHSDTYLRVVCDKKPKFSQIPDSSFEFVRWSESKEVSAIQGAQVGLMPLDNSDWSRGKCSFKMLQYMAVGIPVIASNVGMNCEVFGKGEVGFCAEKNGDFYKGLSELYGSENLCAMFGRNGRRVIEDWYSVNVVASNLAKLIKEAA